MNSRVTKIVILSLLLPNPAIVVSFNVYAEPVTLKCVTTEGREAADLMIDIDNEVMKWGINTYDIIHIDDKYISAYLRPYEDVGGEIWVIDRRTGEYKRGSVAVLFSKIEDPDNLGNIQGRLRGNIYTGKCVKQLF